LGAHGFHVGLCLVPAVLAFGWPGLVYLVLVVGSHMVVDRWKVKATRRAEAVAQEQARARIERTGQVPASGLGAAWTPWPGILFLADQVLHLTFAIVGWLVLLAGAALLPGFVDFVNAIFRDWDRATVHAAILTGLVIVSLLIVNTRAAYYFVLSLVSPRDLAPVPGAAAAPAAPEPAPPAPSGFTVRVGPLAATVAPTSIEPGIVDPGAEADVDHPAPASPVAPAPAPQVAVPSGAPARIGATIGALERLLIVAFMLTGAEAAVGFVIAAKTIARFKQLDDRGFAEYYLLGTLASVAVAISTSLVALGVLGTLS
ncbi:MAG TPA: DUF3307 domain-containing protein, partial [Candidatus Limnocylindrales bacterium]